MDPTPEDREYAVRVITELADLLEAGATHEELREHATAEDNHPPSEISFLLVAINVGESLSAPDTLTDLRRRAAELESA